jgi:hypothetical protein
MVVMKRSLLCELHAHTIWSDGDLSVRDLVDLYGTARFAEQPEWAGDAVHRLELVNRHDVFPWVAERRLPVVACGDFHSLEHLSTWKTLVPCAKTEEALVDYLRSSNPVDLTRIDERSGAGGLAA